MTKTIYFAGGCFWGTEKAFKSLSGVVDTTVGYANGTMDNPTYRDVCGDKTGHRETVKVVYDPAACPLEKLLRAFFLIIDPTVSDRQGNDVGTQYQTGVYYEDAMDLPTIQAAFAGERGKHGRFLVELEPLRCFWPAEEYHQDYLDKNPGGYCYITGAEMDAVRGMG